MISKLAGLGADPRAGHRPAPTAALADYHVHGITTNVHYLRGGPRPPGLPLRRATTPASAPPSRRSSCSRPTRRSSRSRSSPRRSPPTSATTTGPRSSPPGRARARLQAWARLGRLARCSGEASDDRQHVRGAARRRAARGGRDRGAGRPRRLRGDHAGRDPPGRRLPPRPRHRLAPGGRGELLGPARRARQRHARAPARLGLPARDPRRAPAADASRAGHAHRRRGRQPSRRGCPGRVRRRAGGGPGDAVREGEGVLVVEAMGMENEVRSPKDGNGGRARRRRRASVEGGAALALSIKRQGRRGRPRSRRNRWPSQGSEGRGSQRQGGRSPPRRGPRPGPNPRQSPSPLRRGPRPKAVPATSGIRRLAGPYARSIAKSPERKKAFRDHQRRHRSSRSTARPTSRPGLDGAARASRASTRSPAACSRPCTAAASGPCASTPASAPPRSRTSATATCSSQGQTGLSVAFDLPTQMGYDSDHPRARGEVGKVGVAIDSLADMETLLRRHPARQGLHLDDHQLHGGDPARAVPGRRPRSRAWPPAELQGTIQNDILKEYMARGTYIYPPRPSHAASSPTSSPTPPR